MADDIIPKDIFPRMVMLADRDALGSNYNKFHKETTEAVAKAFGIPAELLRGKSDGW